MNIYVPTATRYWILSRRNARTANWKWTGDRMNKLKDLAWDLIMILRFVFFVPLIFIAILRRENHE